MLHTLHSITSEALQNVKGNFLICTPHHMLLPSTGRKIILKCTLKIQGLKAAD